MTYVLIQDGVVIQKQPYAQAGFIEVDDAVHCGQLFDGSMFSNPPPVPPTALENIAALEALETPRRLAEAALGDTVWLQANRDKIAAERLKL